MGPPAVRKEGIADVLGRDLLRIAVLHLKHQAMRGIFIACLWCDMPCYFDRNTQKKPVDLPHFKLIDDSDLILTQGLLACSGPKDSGERDADKCGNGIPQGTGLIIRLC